MNITKCTKQYLATGTCTPNNECERVDPESSVKQGDGVLPGAGIGIGKGLEALPDGSHGGQRAVPNNFPLISGV